MDRQLVLVFDEAAEWVVGLQEIYRDGLGEGVERGEANGGLTFLDNKLCLEIALLADLEDHPVLLCDHASHLLLGVPADDELELVGALRYDQAGLSRFGQREV